MLRSYAPVIFFSRETHRVRDPAPRGYPDEQIRRERCAPERCAAENLGRHRNTYEALDLIESLIKCTPAPITEPFYDSRFGKLSEIVPD